MPYPLHRKLPNFEVRTRNKTPIPVVLRRLNGGSVLIPKISCNFGCRRWCIISYCISARHFLRGLHSRLHPHHRFFFETPASTLDLSGVFVTPRNFDKSFYGAFPFFCQFSNLFLIFLGVAMIFLYILPGAPRPASASWRFLDASSEAVLSCQLELLQWYGSKTGGF